MTVRSARPAPVPMRLLALVALLLLAACSSGTAEDEDPPGVFRRIETAKGTVEIPERPERIVTLGFEASVLLDLGVVPVGMAADAYAPSGVASYNREPVEGEAVELIDTSTAELPYEQIAGLRPDLILAGTYYDIDKAYDRLTEIAPVISYVKGSYVDTWQEQATLIGKATGKEVEAEAAIDRLNERIQNIAAEHPGWADKTFSMSFNYDTGKITTIVNPNDFAIQLLIQLGLTLSPKVAGLAGEDLTIQPDVSYESFANLPSARDGRVITVDLVSVNALRTPMLRGIDHALDLLVPELERALDGT